MDDLINREAAIKAACEGFCHPGLFCQDTGCKELNLIKAIPSVLTDKKYTKAVTNWLMQYQIKTAELQGRYTPYEILGWVINDWRKENDC